MLILTSRLLVTTLFKLSLVGESNLIPDKLTTIATYCQFRLPKSGQHESISEYDILKYGTYKIDKEESVQSSDSDNEVDVKNVYSDNPLYTSKRNIPTMLNMTKEIPKSESTPQPTEKQVLMTKIKSKLIDLPSRDKSYRDIKPKRKYSIDSMLVLSRLKNNISINRDNDRSMLKRKLFPVWRKLGINDKHSNNRLHNRTLDSKFELFNQNRRILKVHLHKIEFKEQLNLNRQRNKYGILTEG